MLAIVGKTKAETFELPSLRATSPDYAMLMDRRADLQSERDHLAKQITELVTQLYNELCGTGGGETDIEKRRASRVAALAAGTAAVAVSGPEPETIESVRDQQFVARQKLSEVDDALRVLDSEISNARMAASAIIREQIKPEHDRLVADICERLIELHAANAAYHEFTANCNAEQIAWSSLEPMFPRFLGEPRGAGSKIGNYLTIAAAKRFISKSQIPSELRQ